MAVLKRDITRQAQQVWRTLYPKTHWPARWRVVWRRGLVVADAKGDTDRRRRVIRIDPAEPDVVETLLHEFAHMLRPDVPHETRTFVALEDAFRLRLGFPPLAVAEYENILESCRQLCRDVRDGHVLKVAFVTVLDDLGVGDNYASHPSDVDLVAALANLLRRESQSLDRDWWAAHDGHVAARQLAAHGLAPRTPRK